MDYEQLKQTDCRAIFIAEAGINHDGNLDTAKKMVDAAVEDFDFGEEQNFAVGDAEVAVGGGDHNGFVERSPFFKGAAVGGGGDSFLYRLGASGCFFDTFPVSGHLIFFGLDGCLLLCSSGFGLVFQLSLWVFGLLVWHVLSLFLSAGRLDGLHSATGDPGGFQFG